MRFLSHMKIRKPFHEKSRVTLKMKTEKHNHCINKLFLPFSILIVFLCVLYFDAYLYDTLAYHAPFSALTLNLPIIEGFRFNEGLLDRFQGFPPFWRFALGPSLIFGLPRLMIIPNILSLSFLLWVLNKTKILPWKLGIIVLFVFPVTLFSFRSAYQDFFVGAVLTASFFLACYSIYFRQKVLLLVSVSTISLSSLTKYQGLMQSIVLLFVLLLSLVILGVIKQKPLISSKSYYLIIAFGISLIMLHPIHNLVVFSNPFYPIDVGPFRGPESNYIDSSSYTSVIYPFHGLFNHLLSASELDWIFRGVVPSYSIDMARSQTQYGGLLNSVSEVNLIRTGGTYAPAYIATMLIYFIGLQNVLRNTLKSKSLNYRQFAYLAAGIFLFLSSFLPQSHELRYYLATLMILSLTTISYSIKMYPKITYFLILTFAIASLAFNLTQPIYSTFKNGLVYAFNYPSRDLPNRLDCISYKADPADRFACQIVLHRNGY